MAVLRGRSRSETFDGADLGFVVPLGSWRPDGDAPLVLPFRRGAGAAAVGGLAVTALGIFLVVWCAWLGVYSSDIAQRPIARLIGLLAGLVVTAVGGFVVAAVSYARKAVVVVGPSGVVLRRRPAVRLSRSVEAVYWEELTQVGVCVTIVRTVRLLRGLVKATDTAVTVRLGLLPRVPGFGGPKRPNLAPLSVPSPYTHGMGVPQPAFGSDGRHLPVVRDLDAALRHFAPAIYAGIHEDVSTRDRT